MIKVQIVTALVAEEVNMLDEGGGQHPDDEDGF